MRWIIVFVLLTIAVPVWAANKKNVKVKPEPQQTQQVEQSESSLWNQKMCPQGIERLENLFNLNPFDSQNRCFNYTGRLVQLLNRNQAFFSILTDTTPFALVDFGKDSAPMNYYSGVVLGKGAYSYQTVIGSQKTTDL